MKLEEIPAILREVIETDVEYFAKSAKIDQFFVAVSDHTPFLAFLMVRDAVNKLVELANNIRYMGNSPLRFHIHHFGMDYD